MKIPDAVNILGKQYTIFVGRKDLELSKKSRWGECNHVELTIDIRGDLAHANQEESFLHELLHTAEAAVLAENVAEQVIYGMSAVLYAILKDNGWWPDG